MFYCAGATETVVSPTDDVISNSDFFDSWWKMDNYSTCGGELKFYKSNGITTCIIPLLMRNKLWYLKRDVTSTVYRAKIRSSSNTFAKAITNSTLYNLWHHCVCYAGKFATNHIDEVDNSIPSLRKRSPFFSCSDCSKGKMMN